MTADSELAWRRLLTVVVGSQQPLTGRQVAAAAGVSPTTASRVLRELEDQQLVTSTARGRATLWRSTPAANDALNEVAPRAVKRRALILTALPLEMAALKSQLPDGRIRRAPNGVRTFVTTLVGDLISWEIRAFVTGMGNAASAAAAAHSLDGFVPDILVFVGVAGGLKPNGQKHGDVVIVNRAYNASAGKEATGQDGATAFLTRPVSERISLPLEELAGQVAATMRLPASITIGPVASTEAVLGTADGPLYQRIRSALNDCSIVDMESYGVLAGARRLEVPAISVRGISDLVDDKTPAADEQRQPAAASNAAKVAIQLLRDADPDDVRPSIHQRPEHVEPGVDGQAALVTVLEHDGLPASAQPWHEQLLTHDPDRAETARLELLGWRSGAIATYASRIVDRPPAWLRTDDTGEAWAMVAAVADTADAGVASRAYEEAAHRAAKAGANDVAGCHLVSAVLAKRRTVGVDDETHSRELLAELAALDLSDAPSADIFRTFLVSGVREEGEDWARALEAAAEALTFFGVELGEVGLKELRRPSGNTRVSPDRDFDVAPSPISPTDRTQLPEPIRRALVGRFVLQVATLQLYDERGLAGLQAADLSMRLLPGSGSAKLRRAQALLTVLHTNGGSAGLGRASDVLAEVERLAMEAHSTLTDWDASGTEALALAGRALTEAGDPRGALRLLCPPPAGTATPREADSNDVARVVVGAALMVGDHELALKAAERVEATGEALLMKANALERSPGMRSEAREAYRDALAKRGADRTVLERAVLGLARVGEPLQELEQTPHDGSHGEPISRSTPASSASSRQPSRNPTARKVALQSALDELYLLNPRLADIAVGEAALRHGDAPRALALARRHRDHAQGVELAADAYEALGEPAKATDAMWEFGAQHGDIAMQLEAMMRAGRQGDFDRVTRFSDAVIRDYAGEPRRMARRARIRAAGLTNDWQTVESQARVLLTEAESANNWSMTDSEVASLRWTRVEALYRMREPRLAFDVLTSPTPLAVSTREEAMLALATTYLLVEESANLSGETVDWVLSIASAWIDDEEVCRQAIGILLFSRGDDDLGRISRGREVIERYFETHEENAQIRQIELAGGIDEDTGEAPEGYFEPLYEELKRGADLRQEMLRKVNLEVWLGRLPWTMAVNLLNRTYAGTLIQGASGLHVVSTPSAPAPSSYGMAAASAALDHGSLVVDTSALVLAPKLGPSRRDLLGLFDRIHFPEALREDMFRARAELGRRSDMTMGWDVREDRPRADVADPDDVERWAREAEELCDCLPLLTVQVADGQTEVTYGLHALHLADRLNVAMWADDAALRVLATERGISSFTTLDLLEALRERDGSSPLPTPDQIAVAGRKERIVDISLTTPWWELARDDSWLRSSSSDDLLRFSVASRLRSRRLKRSHVGQQLRQTGWRGEPNQRLGRRWCPICWPGSSSRETLQSAPNGSCARVSKHPSTRRLTEGAC
jgi:nucleoside phosphorylase